MLTRISVKGFKNLIDTEVRFGAFTCIAGINGVGKSNLFDVIAFISNLTSHNIVEAALMVRGSIGNTSNSIASLFARKAGSGWKDIELSLDFIVPKMVLDDFSRKAEPSSTFLTYKIGLRYVEYGDGGERIELLEEELTYISKTDAKKRIGFPVNKLFLESVLGGNKRSDFISTQTVEGTKKVILLHQDQAKGSPSRIPASTTPRTVLSTVNTDDRPTALAARREMQSWAQLQLEPSKLRMPDSFNSDERLSSTGEHLPSALLRLNSFDKVANILAGLLPNVDGLRVDIDEARRSRTLYLGQRNGQEHPARSLSDGTLRFLALAVLACDPQAGGVICMEEPENGIHPARIPAIVELLKSIAVDVQDAVNEDNPLRQIIINTHSPIVIRNLNIEDLILATPVRLGLNSVTTFASIRKTWRDQIHQNGLRAPPVTRESLIDYLENIKIENQYETANSAQNSVAIWAQSEFGF